ncbi:MAG: DMT family transporter [Alicyclobacillaceae bacterium]|nr:DMT family transporter [Alicyclobacillaceae bacterium]
MDKAAVLMLVLANLFWAGNYLLGSVLSPVISAGALTTLRWWIAFAVLWPLVRREGVRLEVVRRHLGGLGFLAATGVGGYGCVLYEALHHTTAVNASLIAGVNPAVIAVLSALWERTRISGRQILGLLLSLAGVVVVVSRGDWRLLAGLRFNLGDLLMFVCVVLWSVYSLYVPRVQREVGPMTTAWVTSGMGAVMGLVPAALDWRFVSTGMTWAGVVYIGVFASVLAYVCWNEGVVRLKAGQAGIFLNLLPVFTMILAALIGQPVRAVQWIGGLLVVTGVTLTLAPARPKARSVA